MGLGAVSNFDIVRIGGREYSVSELFAKAPTIFANSDTKVYTSAFDNSAVKYITKAGNPLGKYYSYLKPGPNRSKSWLMLETGPAKYVFVPNEVVGSRAIANQDVKTVTEQLQEESDLEQKDKDPILYYLKKVGLPLALGAGGIYLVGTLGKEVIKAKLTKPSMSGINNSTMKYAVGLLAVAAVGGGAWYFFNKRKARAVPLTITPPVWERNRNVISNLLPGQIPGSPGQAPILVVNHIVNEVVKEVVKPMVRQPVSAYADIPVEREVYEQPFRRMGIQRDMAGFNLLQ